MTENKRFYLLNYKNYPIYDSLNDKEYNAQFKVQREKLCLLLNKLNDENKHLNYDNERMVKFIMSKGYGLKDYLDFCKEYKE